MAAASGQQHQTADPIRMIAHAAAEAATPSADTENKYECPFCVMMRKGGCEDVFKAFMECGEKADKGQQEMADCLPQFEALHLCMEKNKAVFDNLLQEMKDEEDKSTRPAAAAATGGAAGSSSNNQQQQSFNTIQASDLQQRQQKQHAQQQQQKQQANYADVNSMHSTLATSPSAEGQQHAAATPAQQSKEPPGSNYGGSHSQQHIPGPAVVGAL